MSGVLGVVIMLQVTGHAGGVPKATLERGRSVSFPFSVNYGYIRNLRRFAPFHMHAEFIKKNGRGFWYKSRIVRLLSPCLACFHVFQAIPCPYLVFPVHYLSICIQLCFINYLVFPSVHKSCASLPLCPVSKHNSVSVWSPCSMFPGIFMKCNVNFSSCLLRSPWSQQHVTRVDWFSFGLNKTWFMQD